MALAEVRAAAAVVAHLDEHALGVGADDNRAQGARACLATFVSASVTTKYAVFSTAGASRLPSGSATSRETSTGERAAAAASAGPRPRSARIGGAIPRESARSSPSASRLCSSASATSGRTLPGRRRGGGRPSPGPCSAGRAAAADRRGCRVRGAAASGPRPARRHRLLGELHGAGPQRGRLVGQQAAGEGGAGATSPLHRPSATCRPASGTRSPCYARLTELRRTSVLEGANSGRRPRLVRQRPLPRHVEQPAEPDDGPVTARTNALTSRTGKARTPCREVAPGLRVGQHAQHPHETAAAGVAVVVRRQRTPGGPLGRSDAPPPPGPGRPAARPRGSAPRSRPRASAPRPRTRRSRSRTPRSRAAALQQVAVPAPEPGDAADGGRGGRAQSCTTFAPHRAATQPVRLPGEGRANPNRRAIKVRMHVHGRERQRGGPADVERQQGELADVRRDALAPFRPTRPPGMPDHLDMRRGRWGQDLGLLRAASTGGVIRARLLVDLGVPERTVYARCRDGGAWRRLLPGIILLSNGSPTREQMLTAALMHGGTTR